MDLVVYYEGADSIKSWVDRMLPGTSKTFKKLPTSNKGGEFTRLPRYIADILYLDKPDIIISGSTDGIHEKPIFSIELAGCTPQYQHALQRFPRMLASVENGCPAILIMAATKAENSGGGRVYQRSQAIDYAAVRLLDTYGVPAFVFDWPQVGGILQQDGSDDLPPVASTEMQALSSYLQLAIRAFMNVEYIPSLMRLPSTRQLIEKARLRAYRSSQPTIERPGGGDRDGSGARLDLVKTSDLMAKIVSDGRASPSALSALPDFLRSRDMSLVMYPTRLVRHAGDPYVGMLCYYDIAFCRFGESNRDRQYNLVAYCNGVGKDEVEGSMRDFVSNVCPFSQGLSERNILSYSYHLRNGCSNTKSKPIRIYAEIADLIVFEDGILIGG